MSTLSNIENFCYVNSAEKDLLESPAAPIVLLQKKPYGSLPEVVAPGQNYLGFMLPYSPFTT